jgi:hypothetical protein
MTPYPKSYHAACNHLVAFGGHGGNRLAGRRLIARALWDLRHAFGRARARRERMHMLFISGQFPVKHDEGDAS